MSEEAKATAEEDAKAAKIQALYRGNKAREEVSEKRKHMQEQQHPPPAPEPPTEETPAPTSEAGAGEAAPTPQTPPNTTDTTVQPDTEVETKVEDAEPAEEVVEGGDTGTEDLGIAIFKAIELPPPAPSDQRSTFVKSSRWEIPPNTKPAVPEIKLKPKTALTHDSQKVHKVFYDYIAMLVCTTTSPFRLFYCLRGCIKSLAEGGGGLASGF